MPALWTQHSPSNEIVASPSSPLAPAARRRFWPASGYHWSRRGLHVGNQSPCGGSRTVGQGQPPSHPRSRAIPARTPQKQFPSSQQPDFLGRFIGKNAADMQRWPSYSDRDQLFDLRADPMEQTNLATDPQHAAKLAEMRTLLKTTLAPLPHVFGEFKTATAP